MQDNLNIEIALLKDTDAWKICNFIVSNEERFRKYLPVTVAQNLDPTLSRIFVDAKLKGIKKQEEFLYTIKTNPSRLLIGLVYLKNIDLDKKQAEFAYAMDYRHTGKGIISFTIKRLITDFNKEMGIKTFQIIVNEENKGSIRVAEKCQFKWIKTLPKVFEPPGKPAMDMELYQLELP